MEGVGAVMTDGAGVRGGATRLSLPPVTPGKRGQGSGAPPSPEYLSGILVTGFARGVPAPSPHNNKMGLHLLFADDEAVNKAVFKRMAGRLGCTCLLLSDGDEVEPALVAAGQVVPQGQGAGGGGERGPNGAGAGMEGVLAVGSGGRPGQAPATAWSGVKFGASGARGRTVTDQGVAQGTLGGRSVHSTGASTHSLSAGGGGGASAAPCTDGGGGGGPDIPGGASQAYRVGPGMFHAIVLDIHMSRMHGDTVCKNLRALGLTTPIIAATGAGVCMPCFPSLRLPPSSPSPSPSPFLSLSLVPLTCHSHMD